MTIKTYVTRVALAEDINNPFIWFSKLPCDSREIVKVTNKNLSKTIWCEVVKASDNFVVRYNQNKRTLNLEEDKSFIVANAWYRTKLGLTKNESTIIEVSTSKLPLFFKQLLASYSHPDNNVRLAVDLALVSVLLGFIGLILGAISLWK